MTRRGSRHAAADGQRVAGVDEAGRGPLAGPVVAAAVILDAARPIAGLRDSKQLPPPRREALAALIRERALAWALGFADAREIDVLDIRQATLLAMRRALQGLAIAPMLVRVDGRDRPSPAMLGFHCPFEAIVRGDALCPEVSAASILAKVARDGWMRLAAPVYPGYGFERHMGYPTSQHLTRLARQGPCALHRRSFAPVRSVHGTG